MNVKSDVFFDAGEKIKINASHYTGEGECYAISIGYDVTLFFDTLGDFKNFGKQVNAAIGRVK